MSKKSTNDVKRVTGLLVIEVVNSNPNGNPDQDSDPRQRPDWRGEISPVSFKRKVRDLIEDKEGIVWEQVSSELKLDAKEFGILESRGRDRAQIEGEINDGTFSKHYWDGRVFGNTFLEKGATGSIKTGVVQLTMFVYFPSFFVLYQAPIHEMIIFSFEKSIYTIIIFILFSFIE